MTNVYAALERAARERRETSRPTRFSEGVEDDGGARILRHASTKEFANDDDTNSRSGCAALVRSRWSNSESVSPTRLTRRRPGRRWKVAIACLAGAIMGVIPSGVLETHDVALRIEPRTEVPLISVTTEASSAPEKKESEEMGEGLGSAETVIQAPATELPPATDTSETEVSGSLPHSERSAPELVLSQSHAMPPSITPEVSRTSSQTPLSESEVANLLARGRRLQDVGDVVSARLFFELAAENGSTSAATDIGKTYDPTFLKKYIGHPLADPAKAVWWYREAVRAGEPEAQKLLDALQLLSVLEPVRSDAAGTDRLLR